MQSKKNKRHSHSRPAASPLGGIEFSDLTEPLDLDFGNTAFHKKHGVPVRSSETGDPVLSSENSQPLFAVVPPGHPDVRPGELKEVLVGEEEVAPIGIHVHYLPTKNIEAFICDRCDTDWKTRGTVGPEGMRLSIISGELERLLLAESRISPEGQRHMCRGHRHAACEHFYAVLVRHFGVTA